MKYQIKRWQMVVGAALSIGFLVGTGLFEPGVAQVGTVPSPLGGIILGFEQPLVEIPAGGTVTTIGHVNRVSNQRTITLTIDSEKGEFPDGSEVAITPNFLDVKESEQSLEPMRQTFQLTIKIPEGLQRGRYAVSVKAKDEISEVDNVLIIAVERGR
jgi:hypothetical protein